MQRTAPVPQNTQIPLPQIENLQGGQPADDLLGYVMLRANTAATAYQPTLERFRKAALAMQCQYSPEELQRFKGDAIYMGLVNAKCRTSAAWLLDVLANHVERPWSLETSPITTLPDEMQQLVEQRLELEAQRLGIDPAIMTDARDKLTDLAKTHATEVAKESVTRLEDFIADMLTESGWSKEFEAFVHDLRRDVESRCRTQA